MGLEQKWHNEIIDQVERLAEQDGKELELLWQNREINEELRHKKIVELVSRRV